jgi:hypothetical protein
MSQIKDKTFPITSHYINSNTDVLATTSTRNPESQNVQKTNKHGEREREREREREGTTPTALKG